MQNGNQGDAGPAGQGWSPLSEGERDAVRQQLRRLLESPLFRISRRYPALLRHIVEETLQGRTGRLKERYLGVEVFGRDRSYDTSAEPVVRMTATQIRRRLAEYYGEPGRETEIRIELPVGSYIPVFHKPASRPPGEAASAPSPQPAAGPSKPRGRRNLVYIAAAIVVLASVGVGVGLRRWAGASPLDDFWAPVLNSSDRVLVCVGGGLPPASQSDLGQLPTVREVIRQHRIAWADALTFSSLSGFLQARGKTTVSRRAGETSFAQMREAPSVLIGGYNNEWILRFTDPLRFRYVQAPNSSFFYIQDRQNPENRLWGVDVSAPHADFVEDYGIVMRYFEPTTQQYVVVASGIAYYATMAAAEFLTGPSPMEALATHAPQDWRRRNLEAVFSTRIINGETGSPRILATHYW